MTLDYFRDILFDLLNESEELDLADLQTDEENGGYLAVTEDGKRILSDCVQGGLGGIIFCGFALYFADLRPAPPLRGHHFLPLPEENGEKEGKQRKPTVSPASLPLLPTAEMIRL